MHKWSLYRGGIHHFLVQDMKDKVSLKFVELYQSDGKL